MKIMGVRTGGGGTTANLTPPVYMLQKGHGYLPIIHLPMAHLLQLAENMPLRTVNQEQVRYTLSSLLNLFFDFQSCPNFFVF